MKMDNVKPLIGIVLLLFGAFILVRFGFKTNPSVSLVTPCNEYSVINYKRRDVPVRCEEYYLKVSEEMGM